MVSLVEIGLCAFLRPLHTPPPQQQAAVPKPSSKAERSDQGGSASGCGTGKGIGKGKSKAGKGTSGKHQPHGKARSSWHGDYGGGCQQKGSASGASSSWHGGYGGGCQQKGSASGASSSWQGKGGDGWQNKGSASGASSTWQGQGGDGWQNKGSDSGASNSCKGYGGDGWQQKGFDSAASGSSQGGCGGGWQKGSDGYAGLDETDRVKDEVKSEHEEEEEPAWKRIPDWRASERLRDSGRHGNSAGRQRWWFAMRAKAITDGRLAEFMAKWGDQKPRSLAQLGLRNPELEKQAEAKRRKQGESSG